jgi:hypothetical protein
MRGTTSIYGYGSRATFRPICNKHRRGTPEWGALHRAWVGYVIAKSQDDLEKMRKYAIVIRKFQRRLNIAISDFLDIGIYGFEEDLENKEEDDDSKLAVYDLLSREEMRNAKEDEDQDEDDDRYYRSATWKRDIERDRHTQLVPERSKLTRRYRVR